MLLLLLVVYMVVDNGREELSFGKVDSVTTHANDSRADCLYKTTTRMKDGIQ